MRVAGTAGKHVLVTGASGFVGNHLVPALAAEGWRVRAASRQPVRAPSHPAIEHVTLPDLSMPYDWAPLLGGITHVVHLAGVAHADQEIPERVYHEINARAVGRLGAAAGAHGAHLVFVSSVRAQCGPVSDVPVVETDEPRPLDAYGRSKLAGEQLLRAELPSASVLRPAIVYGPGVKGNMATLVKLAQTGLPLPFAGLKGRRSMISADNLVASIKFALEHSNATGKTFLAADPSEPPRVCDLIAWMRDAIGRPPRLFAVPTVLLECSMALLCRSAQFDRLAKDLVVDNSALTAAGWVALQETRDGVRAMLGFGKAEGLRAR